MQEMTFYISWAKFLQYLSYKASWYGRKLIVADRTFPSSKMCSKCGYIYKGLQLKDRIWACPVCGTIHDRDENASKNLKNYGIKQIVGQGLSEFTPVEWWVAATMKQEATTSKSGW